MRVLEARGSLEAAVYECKARSIDTPEVKEAYGNVRALRDRRIGRLNTNI